MSTASLPTYRSERGFTILESLVTVVILAFGALGLAALQTKVQLAEMDSYQRSQALIALEDMVARINANRASADTYATYVTDNGPVGTGDGQPDLGSCAAKAIGPDRDICEWSNQLKGSTEQSTGNVGAMIGGRGCIDRIAAADPPSFLVTVVWQGMNKTVAPSFACARGLYGTEDNSRRAVAKIVTIANLTPP